MQTPYCVHMMHIIWNAMLTFIMHKLKLDLLRLVLVPLVPTYDRIPA